MLNDNYTKTRLIPHIIRNASRNPLIRRLTPYFIQKAMWDRVLHSKGRNLVLALLEHLNTHDVGLNDTAQLAVEYLKTHKNGFFESNFYEIFLKNGILDFGGIKLPDITSYPNMMYSLYQIFPDVYLFPVFLNGDYGCETVEYFDSRMMEGPYGYVDDEFNVTVGHGDVCIDAGAWIGDFSAYAASLGATCYAFEPSERNFQWLKITEKLNENRVIPVQMGLGEIEQDIMIADDTQNTSGSTMFFAKGKTTPIHITTIDNFVNDNNIKKLDFIKSDIEGAERDLLRGARKTLSTLGPKLAICTYHNPEDPKLLERLILEANPRYIVRHTHQKLFAMII